VTRERSGGPAEEGLHLGRYREAEDALRFALSLDPELEAAYYNLAGHDAEKRPDEAKAFFRRARRSLPSHPSAGRPSSDCAPWGREVRPVSLNCSFYLTFPPVVRYNASIVRSLLLLWLSAFGGTAYVAAAHSL